MTVGEDNELHLEPQSFYRVPFLNALDLVQNRQVIVKGVCLIKLHLFFFFFL